MSAFQNGLVKGQHDEQATYWGLPFALLMGERELNWADIASWLGRSRTGPFFARTEKVDKSVDFFGSKPGETSHVLLDERLNADIVR